MAGNNGNGALSFDARSAIRKKIRVGERIQQDFPEIADSYKGGRSLNGLVGHYDIKNHYDVNADIAKGATWLALNELISVDEMRKIGKEHMSNSGKIAVARLKDEKIGLEFLEHDYLVELARRGGITSRDKKKGIFSRTPGEHSTDSRKAGRISAEKRGQIPWGDEEAAFAYSLSKDFYTWGEVRGKLNDKFHDGRNVRETSESVAAAVYRFKKRSNNGKTAKQ